MSMNQPPLMHSMVFKARTTKPGSVVRSTLAPLDKALAKMDFTPFASMAKKIGWCRDIIAQCAIWQGAKAHKLIPGPAYSANTAARALVVGQVADQAMALLKYLTFEEQKANRPAHVPSTVGNQRSLQHGHQNEKLLYEQGKAQSPGNVPVNFPGGSLVEANMPYLPQNAFGALPPPVQLILNNGTPFANLSQLEFQTLATFFGGQNLSMQRPVHYARKEERVNEHMLIVNNGLFEKQPNQPYTTPFDMWAMDVYGNFMATAGGAQVNGAQYNHSSLNAGNNVLCAGTVIITNGVIMEIDNQSGHYRPTRQNLHTALNVLFHDLGVTFDANCVVRSHTPPFQRRFNSHLAFIANVNAPGGWP